MKIPIIAVYSIRIAIPERKNNFQINLFAIVLFEQKIQISFIVKHFQNWMCVCVCAGIKASFICKCLINLHISFGCVNVQMYIEVWTSAEAFQKDLNTKQPIKRLAFLVKLQKNQIQVCHECRASFFSWKQVS